MTAAEAGPLRRHTIGVIGTDAAADHARLVLGRLGADVRTDADAVDAVIEVAPTRTDYDVPAVWSRSRAVVEDWARSGGMWLTGPAGGAPTAGRAGAASILRGAVLVAEVLTMLRTSANVHLPDVTLLGERAAIAGLSRASPWSAGGSARAVRGADGWFMLSLPRASDLDLVPALTERRSASDPWAAVDMWAGDISAVDATDRAQRLGMAAAAIPARDTTIDDVQSRHRGGAAIAITPGGRRAANGRPPLVVDLTSLWAGPLCASLLGAAGADIVKVESTGRPDGARSGPADFYRILHAGHRSVALDLTSETGLAALRGLIEVADVVLESSRPRALEQLGIDVESVVRRGTIWASITAYGRAGPWCNRIGFGDDAAAAAGLIGDDDGMPMPCGDAIADPLAGAHAAAAVAAALLDDHAHLLDVSMRDVAAAAARLPTDPCEVIGSDEQGWILHWEGGRRALAEPVARQPNGDAAELGVDTTEVLRLAGIG